MPNPLTHSQMRTLLLTAAGLALGAGAAVNAQSYVPPVGTVAPGNPAQNPDFRTLPVVETGLPSFDLPGMSTTYADAPTGSLVEGFGADYSASYSSATTQETIYTGADRASQPVSDDDSSEGKWIDRDNDGYDPVVDEIEQGAETAVKATGQALEEVGEEVGELFGNEDPDDVGERDRDGNFITRGVKSAARNTKKVAKGTVKTTGKVAKGTVKTTGKVAKGTVKTTGKVARGTAKAATRPFRDGEASDVDDADVDDLDMGDTDATQVDEEAPMQPSMGNGGDLDEPNR